MYSKDCPAIDNAQVLPDTVKICPSCDDEFILIKRDKCDKCWAYSEEFDLWNKENP
jgi:hypothetical protein